MIDGCGRLGVFVRVLLPLMRPALATIALLTVLNAWNDFLWPLISISDESNYTLQLGLLTYQGQHHTEWAAVMATTSWSPCRCWSSSCSASASSCAR